MSTGRRKGNPDTRQTVLDSARELFAANGYDGTSLRSIASRAEVDVALIHHYFGNKQKLFFEAVSPPVDLAAVVAQVIAQPPPEWPRLLLENVLAIMDSPLATVMIANFRASIREQSSAQMLGKFMLSTVAERLTQALPADIEGDSTWRANLLASQMVGFLVARYILKLDPLASASREDILAAYEPTLRRYLLEPL